jgi:hypothetical protein
LGVGQEFAHFAQKYRSAVSHFEAAKPTRPSRRSVAPVKAPFSWPNNSEETSVGGSAAQFTLNEGTTRSLKSFVNGTGDEFFARASFPGNTVYIPSRTRYGWTIGD